HVPAVFYEGRVFWLGTDSSNRTYIFYTPNRIDQQGGTLNSNRQLYGRTLNFVPNGFSVLVENGWFVGTSDGRLLRLDMPRILSGDTSSDPYQQVALPGGVQPRLDLQPIVHSSRLYLVGSDNRLHALSSTGAWITQSARPNSAVGNISCPPLLTSRAIVVGTSNGYVVMFDLITGGIRLSRQVGTEAIRSLTITRDERYLLVQMGNTRVVALTASQGSTYWLVHLPDPMVAPLAYEPNTDSLLLLTRSGWLYALSGSTGTIRPHYPQQVFTGQPLQRAMIATLCRTDRKSPYAYVLAQQEISGSSATQGRLTMVAVLNPYNRYEVPEQQMGSQSEYLPAMVFTGDAIGDLCLVFQKQAYAGTNTQGIVVAFPVQ
ncbi:MAG: PQQ-like beta-propeller repeat protein, partial [Fimbriimonadales bacterium]|nr:PQQ-like beta-propeller repeat protein [Fimbriimonadales bacterium]